MQPSGGTWTPPAFPSLLPERPHTFRDEPFPKHPTPFLVLEKQALLWGTGLFCGSGNSHSSIITVLVGLSSHTVLEVPTLSISGSSSHGNSQISLCLRTFSPSKFVLESSPVPTCPLVELFLLS